MHHATTALLTAAVLGLGLAGCADDAGDASGTAAQPTADQPTTDQPAPDQPTSTDTSAPAASGATVEIDDFGYDPATTTVEAGTTVTWTNEDATAHTVTAGSEDAPEPDRFDEEVTEQGQTIEVTFDEPGTQAYYCTIHPFMQGTIEVTG